MVELKRGSTAVYMDALICLPALMTRSWMFSVRSRRNSLCPHCTFQGWVVVYGVLGPHFGEGGRTQLRTDKGVESEALEGMIT